MRRHSSIDLPANPGLIKPSGFQAKLLLLKDNFPDNFSIRRFSPLNSKLCFVELRKRFWQRFKSKTNWGRVASKIRFSLPFQNHLLSSQIWTRLLKLTSLYRLFVWIILFWIKFQWKSWCLGFLAPSQGCKSAQRWPLSLHKGETWGDPAKMQISSWPQFFFSSKLNLMFLWLHKKQWKFDCVVF